MANAFLRSRVIGRAFLCASTILASGIAFPALAQSADPLPSVRETLDSHGVDLSTGAVSIQVANISIGDLEGGLNFKRTLASTSNYEDDYIGETRDIGSEMIVVFGGVSEKFTKFGNGTFNATEATGSTLTTKTGPAGYVYTKSDGTVVVFDGPKKFSNTNGYGVGGLRVTSYTLPNGIKKIFNYEYSVATSVNSPPFGQGYAISSRVSSVSTNAGYNLKLEYKYAANYPTPLSLPANEDWHTLKTVIARNSNIDTCTAVGCTPTSSRPSITIGGTPSARTYTDSLGNVTAVNLGVGTITIRSPGRSADNMVYTLPSGKVSQSVVNGVTANYAYTDVGNDRTVLRSTTAGSETYKFYIPSLQLTEYIDPLARKTTYTYDPTTRLLTQILYPEGNKAKFSYDARGNVIEARQISKTPGAPADIVTTASYPASCIATKTCNKPDWTRDAKGNQSDFAYDANHGGLLSVTGPADVVGGVRPQSRYSYTTLVTSNGNVTKLTSISVCRTTAICVGVVDETRTEVAYGTVAVNNLQPQSVTVKAGDNSVSATTGYTYDIMGNVLTFDGPLSGSGDTTRIRYDNLRRRVGQIGPDPDGTGPRLPIAKRVIYNAESQPTLVAVGNVTDQSDTSWNNMTVGQSEVGVYDADGRIVKSETKSGTTTYAMTQTSYDALGRPECVAQRMDPAVWAGQSAACTPQTTGPQGADRVRKTIYDAAGQATQTQTAFGTTEQATEVTATYTANGRIETVSDGENNRTTYEYDGHSRLYKTRYPLPTQGAAASSASDFVQLTYDPNSNVTQRRLRDGQLINYTIDNLNRVTLKDLPGTEPDVTFSYDLLNRPLTAVMNTLTVGFQYDGLGRKTRETSAQGQTDYQFNAAGFRTRITYPGTTSLYIDYVYDNAGNVLELRENGLTTSAGKLAIYDYDNLGRRKSVTFGNGATRNFDYDPVSRLNTLTNNPAGSVNDQTIGFGYNPASQIAALTKSGDNYAWLGHYNINRAYDANGLNQLTTSGATALSYDARGNLTTAGLSSYSYNSQNQLLTGPNSASLGYDAVGRLQKISGVGVATTRFQYDGADLIAEYQSGVVQRRFVHGPSVDEPILWYEGSGLADKRYLMSDERGTIVNITDSSGVVLGINKYDEFGIPAVTNIGRFGYTGQTWLTELGMNYYKARIYSPTLGRFMQTDPIGYGDGMNWYNYVGSDPVNGKDPSGLGTLVSGVGGSLPLGGDSTADICSTTPICVNARRFIWPSAGNAGTRGGLLGFGPGPGFFVTPSGSSELGNQFPNTEAQAKACLAAADENGKIETSGISWSASFVFGFGWTAGRFKNMNTGTTGYFTTHIWQAGFDVSGASFEGQIAPSLRSFVGIGDAAAAGVDFWIAEFGYSQSWDLDGQATGRGFNVAFSNPFNSSPKISASLVGQMTETVIYGCSLGSGPGQ